MKIETKTFGMHNNQEVLEYTLSNSNNYSLSVISYGGIITKLEMPNRDGKVEDITLNMKTLEEFVERRPFHGALIGPVSGRISGASYMDGDTVIKLDENENTNNLHSGFTGMDQHIWSVETKEEVDEASLILTTIMPDGESGFPGNVKVLVVYSLNEQNEVKIAYKAETNQKTLFNPTNHVYFNLNGNMETPVYNHELQVNSDRFGVLDDENIPTGELREVEDTIFDLRKFTNVGDVLKNEDPQIVERNGLDHPFLLNQSVDQPAVILKEKDSGRVLTLTTDADAIVIFSHNKDFEPATAAEEVLPMHAGLTLETCLLPDAVNQEGFGSIWLEPGEPFVSETIFALSVE